ncbi:spore germination protein GerPE [Bacillus sp. DTU_2020_1000418_1_SI_GHA_SEK_038]|uniref:spore germination protein GerPE n=1 Tax=Bacillus sp. DTU_2020_1000418_1_SI_GHA_SEK_038 TaxID=3077585 RepID=UPI0028E46067|nr:spore germination protein GerPE [Bacillus sp. DTU_2020_1000418_1_SI_GHA_SEK_038]WNS76817.1 spore germination protein GerPE [Bacillus sp. DTU_2020_1000418_1_SI_GHA_SEK_038]
MLSRTSIVDQLKADTVAFSSVIQIGDSTYVHGFTRALAVQRETDTFLGNEGNFLSFKAFTISVPLVPIEEVISMQTMHLNPAIKVNNIDINGISTSSVVHIGSSKHISMEARVKHIRQLLQHE